MHTRILCAKIFYTNGILTEFFFARDEGKLELIFLHFNNILKLFVIFSVSVFHKNRSEGTDKEEKSRAD